jgi:hypothetical protein
MLRYIKTFSLVVGVIMFVISTISLIQDYLVYKNGVRTTGIIENYKLNIVADGANNATYTISTYYKDSQYVLEQFHSVTDFRKGDSLTLYFYPNDLSKSIYIPNYQFNIGNYIGFVIGVLLISLYLYLRRF